MLSSPIGLYLQFSRTKLSALRPDSRVGFVWCAAHKANRAAGESPVRNETNVPVVMTDLPWSDPGQASSVVKAPSGAGQARWRAAALSERCSFVKATTRGPVCGYNMVAEPRPNGRRPSREFRFVRDSLEPSEYGRRHVIKLWQIKVGTFWAARAVGHIGNWRCGAEARMWP